MQKLKRTVKAAIIGDEAIKRYSETYPKAIMVKSDTINGKPRGWFETTAYSSVSYEELVETYVREKYSISDEIGILRQKDDKFLEFTEYNNYVEECKKKAKEFVEERDNG